MTAVDEQLLVFNVVWVRGVFEYLRYFVASQMAHSSARFRFVVNGCPPDEVALIKRFAGRHSDRVVEVFESSSTMEPHGVALDTVLARRDDGEYFCFIDSDILARRPFLRRFTDRLEGSCVGVTSGRVFSRPDGQDDAIATESRILPGDCFYSQRGYLFGSPHFAVYRRGALDDTMSRWRVGLGSSGPDVSAEVRRELAAAGHAFALYDTGKIVNILLQQDGNTLCHLEHEGLMHIGGVSHFLSTPSEEWEEPRHYDGWPAPRLNFARFTAAVLRDACAGGSVVDVPLDVDADMAKRLEIVREELIALVREYELFVRDE